MTARPPKEKNERGIVAEWAKEVLTNISHGVAGNPYQFKHQANRRLTLECQFDIPALRYA